VIIHSFVLALCEAQFVQYLSLSADSKFAAARRAESYRRLLKVTIDAAAQQRLAG
jgi:hypothetical protein